MSTATHSDDTGSNPANGDGPGPDPPRGNSTDPNAHSADLTPTVRTPTHHPTRISSTIAVVAALVAVSLIASSPAQQLALGVDAAGIVALALGGAAWHRKHRIAGALVVLAGLCLVLLSVGVAGTRPQTVSDRIEIIPGLLGAAFVACGVLPLSKRFARVFVSTGAAFVVATIGLSGIVHGAGMLSLLGSFTATVVAWDAGEQAINLGEQLGVDARTWPVELSHSGATAAYGGVAIAAAVGFHTVGVTDVPLLGLFALFGAAVLLLIGLYN